MMKKLLLILLVASISFRGFSQLIKPVAPKSNTNSIKFGIGLLGGTTPGFDVSARFTPNISVRLMNTFLNYTMSNKLTVSDEDIQLNGNLDMNALGLGVELYPSSKSSFKFILGLSYIQKGRVLVVASPTENYKIGETEFTPKEIGEFNFDLSYNGGVARFIGLGFGRAVPKKRVGFGFELGTYYLSEPKVSLTGTERLSSMSEQESKIQNNMKDWRYWPMFNLRLAVRLN
ncbi:MULTISPECIES: hypothetical protein [Flectobacillus]|uniref:hypothetical protein n=1 Tax=Flectobacillus TaxID=101 RepID=UPI000BA34F16|nr:MULTISPECIES: hypothetical protein [Flectobacillus]MDI9871020.1 hypothetical protein [Flectobacillus roseus]PAC31687.1 hypothetical protein BWI92_08370 [Flectobacillus sp. BAB-3569]